MADGLACKTIYDVSQDIDGYIWIATDCGVTRYDGYVFQNFGLEDGLPDNTVLKVRTDSKGRTWFLTMNGKPGYYFNQTFYNAQNSALLAQINMGSFLKQFHEDAAGNVWLVSHRNGCLRISGDEIQGDVTHFHNDMVAHLYETDSGIELVGHTLRYAADGDQLRLMYPLKDTLARPFRYLSDPDSGVTWIATPTGNLNTLGVEADKTELVLSQFGRPNTLAQTSNGALWIAMQQGVLNTSSGEHYLGQYDVTCMYEDRGHNYWFGTRYNGLFFMHSSKIMSLVKTEGGIDQDATTVGKDPDEHIWYSGHRFLQQANGYKVNERLVFENDILNKVWFDGNDRWLFLDGATYLNDRKLDTPIPVKSICKIDSTIFFGNTGIVRCIQQSDFRALRLNKSKNLFSTRVQCFEPDGKGGLYIGSRSGLFHGDRTGFEPVGFGTDEVQHDIAGLARTNGVLWVATNNAGVIAKREDGSCTFYAQSDGLGSNICNAVAVDGRGATWVATNAGLSKIIDNSVVNYNSLAGLPGPEIRDLCIQGDTIWIITDNGLSFLTEQQLRPPSDAKVSITGFSVNGIPYMPQASEHYEFSHRENALSFNFLTILYESHGQLSYRYMLEGLNSNWHQTSARTASYHYLPPGNYRFRVQPIGANSTSEAVLSFSILAPFWQRLWFWMALVALAIFISYVSFRMRIFSYNRDVVRELLQVLLKRSPKASTLQIKTADGAYLNLPVAQVLFFKAARDYVEVVCAEKTYLMRTTMKALEERLKPHISIVRVHRSYFVNIDHITAYHPSQYRNQSMLKIGETEISVGDSYKTNLATFRHNN